MEEKSTLKSLKTKVEEAQEDVTTTEEVEIVETEVKEENVSLIQEEEIVFRLKAHLEEALQEVIHLEVVHQEILLRQEEGQIDHQDVPQENNIKTKVLSSNHLLLNT